MFEGRGRFQWQQTATLEALEININRKSGSKPVSPDELNPFVRRRRDAEASLKGKAAWNALKTIFNREKAK